MASNLGSVMAVYLLWHETDGEDDEKLLRVYFTAAIAQARLEEAKCLPGFRLYADGFTIADYELDRHMWTEGFAIVDHNSWVEQGTWVDDPEP